MLWWAALLSLAVAAAARADALPAAPAAHAAIPWPALRVGGMLSYNARHEPGAGSSLFQQGTGAMLDLGADTYLWEPWLAQLSARVGLNGMQQDTRAAGSDAPGAGSSRSVFMTGDVRLALVPASRFPFEMHYHRSDNRTESQLSFESALAASRFGFTQRLARGGGDALFGWDRSIQEGVRGGEARQDSAHLNLTQRLGMHELRMSGYSNRNRRGPEWAHDDNLSVLHDIERPDTGFTVNSLAQLNRTAYRMDGYDSRSSMAQLSSQAIWRPDDSDLAAVAGVRLFGVNGGAGNAAGAVFRVRHANLNAGASYDWTPAIRFDGSANFNYQQTGRQGALSAQQTARATYLPEPIGFGATRYSWNGAVTASNSGGDIGSIRQLTLQAGHQAARTVQLARSALSVDAGQSLSLRASSARGPGGARHLTHNAAVAWSLLGGNGVAVSASASASDTRELGGSGEFYQLLNLQFSSNLTRGAYGALSGHLTLQAARQSGAILVGDGRDPLQLFTRAGDREVSTVSSGALSYQNERWFGVPHLRLASTLRLNSQALLPVLGREGDQQTAAWETQLDYRIGLTTLRVAYLVARIPVPAEARPGQHGAVPGWAAGAQRTRRGAQFWLSRSFGQH